MDPRYDDDYEDDKIRVGDDAKDRMRGAFDNRGGPSGYDGLSRSNDMGDRSYGAGAAGGADYATNAAPARKVRMARDWPDGSRYDGEWLAGKRHGEGTFTFAKGGRYAGAWADDERDGRGTFYYADTSMYEE